MTIKFSIADKRTASVLTLLILVIVVLTLTQDYLRSDLNNSSFYFSESFMFGSFWWLFAPLLFTQYAAVKYTYKKELAFQSTVIILPILLHLFAFPILVWVLSATLYYHTYSFQQIFKYTLAEQLYLLVLFYSIPVLTFQFFTKKSNRVETISEAQMEKNTTPFINTVVVADRNKKTSIAVSEILYFSANPPYIVIHLEGNKHLLTDTLKSISTKINPEQFIRVHKSTIVNIKMVASYTTRLNGDYDLVLNNNVMLRVSRNYARDFKFFFNKTHHLTTK